MIVVKLKGGLGNQMFQYAIGRHLAFKCNTILKLDKNFLLDKKHQQDVTYRFYQINIFNIIENIASDAEIKRFKNNLLLARILKKIGFNKYYYLTQKSRLFDPNILIIKGNIYLDGYWQSDEYFKDIEDVIKQEFTFKNEPDDRNKKIIKSIQKTDSVSIHVRRGDYVSNPKTNQNHSTCSLYYYSKAVIEILKEVDRPHFFIFSDDMEWVKTNLKISYPTTYVDFNQGQSSYEDMRLMSNCKHNIIANSSFSWWSAWLNKNPNKIVIAPNKWFNNPSIDTKDLILENWLRI